MRTPDFDDKIRLEVEGSNVPSALLEVCKFNICPSLKDSLNPEELFHITYNMIDTAFNHIANLWENDDDFREFVTFFIISHTQLSTLCDTKKYLN